MKITKSSPWVDFGRHCSNNGVGGKGDSAYDLKTSHSHETEIAIESEGAVGLQELAELFTAPHKRAESDY